MYLSGQWSQYMRTLTVDELGLLPECGWDGPPPCMATPTSTGSCPKSLVEFIDRCQWLSLPRSVSDVVAAKALPLKKNLAQGMTPKKRHEVKCF